VTLTDPQSLPRLRIDYIRCMETVYRGTQRPTLEGVRKGASFAYSLPVAVIWSARPGDIWLNIKTQFLSTSTVHTVQIDPHNPLKLSNKSYTYLGSVLRALGLTDDDFADDATSSEVAKVYNYLHNRLIGKAKGGEFLYRVFDEEGERRHEDEVPLSFRHPQSLITLARDDWDYEPSLDTADQLQADTYIFADAPAIQRIAIRRGYDALIYPDVFQGGKSASEELLGCPVDRLEGIEMDLDLEREEVPVHWTFRPLDERVIVEVMSTPTANVIQPFC